MREKINLLYLSAAVGVSVTTATSPLLLMPRNCNFIETVPYLLGSAYTGIVFLFGLNDYKNERRNFIAEKTYCCPEGERVPIEELI